MPHVFWATGSYLCAIAPTSVELKGKLNFHSECLKGIAYLDTFRMLRWSRWSVSQHREMNSHIHHEKEQKHNEVKTRKIICIVSFMTRVSFLLHLFIHVILITRHYSLCLLLKFESVFKQTTHIQTRTHTHTHPHICG